MQFIKQSVAHHLRFFSQSIIFGSLVFLAGAVPALAANKCTSPDGKVTFSDLPCATNDSGTRLKPAADSPTSGVPAKPGDTGAPSAAAQARVRAENKLKDPARREECRALYQRLADLETASKVQKSPAPEAQLVKAKIDERCIGAMTSYLKATKTQMAEQDRIDAVKSEEYLLRYCEKQRITIDSERAKLKREPRENVVGINWMETEYKAQCKVELPPR